MCETNIEEDLKKKRTRYGVRFFLSIKLYGLQIANFL